jgi:deoxyribonuclease-4
MSRLIGLHLRSNENMFGLLAKAERLQMPIFQCFITLPITGHLLVMHEKERQQFKEASKRFKQLYAHISYHANLADPQSLERFKKEVELAHMLGFTHVVVHPGSAKWCANKEQGISILAHTLDELRHVDIRIVLENAAHGNFTIGGDIADFAQILALSHYPEKLEFCIDTAHAYVYGYNIAQEDEQDAFIRLVDTSIGLNKVKLIHLNDTIQELGSKIDKHHIIGQGNIGYNALKRFTTHPSLRHAAVIMELPSLSEEHELEHYHTIISWHK